MYYLDRNKLCGGNIYDNYDQCNVLIIRYDIYIISIAMILFGIVLKPLIDNGTIHLIKMLLSNVII